MMCRMPFVFAGLLSQPLATECASACTLSLFVWMFNALLAGSLILRVRLVLEVREAFGGIRSCA